MKEIDTPESTADYIGRPKATLAQWRWLGRGPRFIKIGGSVRYRKSDVDRWLDENTVEPKPAA
jgi:predicted DNA-binding transcriptional regulator AlpA